MTATQVIIELLFFFVCFCFFFFKQKTAYEIKECDWSSDVCSSDLNCELADCIPKLKNPDKDLSPSKFVNALVSFPFSGGRTDTSDS